MSFGRNKVLKNISLNFNKGEIHCLLGHNGAGKSTFINLLIGNLFPKKGNILYESENFFINRFTLSKKINIGICPSYNVLTPNLTVLDHLLIISRIKNLKNLRETINNILGKL